MYECMLDIAYVYQERERFENGPLRDSTSYMQGLLIDFINKSEWVAVV